MGTALSLENRIDEAIDAHCTGLSYAPFYVPNYFGRGRRHNVKGNGSRDWQTLFSALSWNHRTGHTGTTRLLQRIFKAWWKKVSETSRNA